MYILSALGNMLVLGLGKHPLGGEGCQQKLLEFPSLLCRAVQCIVEHSGVGKNPRIGHLWQLALARHYNCRQKKQDKNDGAAEKDGVETANSKHQTTTRFDLQISLYFR